MGGWKLEVFKMSCYVALPIVCFYMFNKPEYFKELLTRDRRYYFGNEDPNSIKLLEEFRMKKEREIEEKLQAEINALKAKK